ncbi:UDP-N-acetyl-D-glucosamine 2-epimerase, UDP-hydrolysing [Alkalidesulfovibrio alkalitolerans DSM 16529]|uniref:UDP-N-acetyl-D-glucosamine 2-epimerase, UDP-hydrolysing n=1 Tax=Alkalidesulfovibrio alkalitolerans DSM 16529 TaxID=1121439 RepID=S7TEB3_9BACT|nr:UDP-N-acetylglucosamine 2-epimerase [Alkalidesulfovibrio alkalitolerans]EPR35547.1 UDP-N-acetyl-D-glucosamine 2-epimerase, UDP-hydrolysing [Alkalidesulfovibrio alkalitolerans DSM 16529]
MRRKICLIITSRGNYAKMSSIIKAMANHPELEPQIVVGGGALLSKYGAIADAMRQQGIRIDRMVHFLVEGETPVTMAKSAGVAVSEFSTAFDNLKPDVVVVLADRFECLPAAMTAAYMNIPVAHIEGGEVSGSIDESIRHAITKLAHVHFPATSDAAKRIARMGEEPETIFPVGATSLDALCQLDLTDISPMKELQLTTGVGEVVDLSGDYLLAIQHPVTTEYAQNLNNIRQTVAAIEELRMPTIWIWPNMDAGSDGISKGIREFRENKRPDYIHFFKGLAIEHYGPLLNNAACIVGNSSSGIRESAFLGVPAVNIGIRQGGRERGHNVIDVGYDRAAIVDAVRRQVVHGRYEPDLIYGDGKAGSRVVEIVKDFSFTIQKRITY